MKAAFSIVAALMLSFSIAYADLSMPKKKNFYDYMGQGLANIILAPSHLFDSPYGMLDTEGPTVASTKGFVQGVSRMVMDMGVGIAEIAVSPFAPVIDSEFKNPAYDTAVINSYPPSDLYENWY